MGKKHIDAGDIIEVSDYDNRTEVYELEALEGDLRFAPRRKLVGTGRKLNEGSRVQLELDSDDKLFVFNPNSAKATLEVTNR